MNTKFHTCIFKDERYYNKFPENKKGVDSFAGMFCYCLFNQYCSHNHLQHSLVGSFHPDRVRFTSHYSALSYSILISFDNEVFKGDLLA